MVHLGRALLIYHLQLLRLRQREQKHTDGSNAYLCIEHSYVVSESHRGQDRLNHFVQCYPVVTACMGQAGLTTTHAGLT